MADEDNTIYAFEQGYVDRDGNLIFVDELYTKLPTEARLEAVEAQVQELEVQMQELQRTVDNLVETLRLAMGR